MASKDDIARIADENGLSQDAVAELDRALGRGRRTQAQFSHPDLGGSGQWMAGGMTQIGDMFNNGLKAKVDAACSALASLGSARDDGDPKDGESEDGKSGDRASGSDWWPDDLGSPSSSGGQNDSAYAVFPDARRLAVKSGDEVKVYDTGEHHLTGVSQQEGSIEDTTFSTSDGGTVRAGDLDEA